MDTEGIYKLASEVTEEQIQNELPKFGAERIGTFDSLVRLGDSRQLAFATVVLNKPICEETKEFYKMAYRN